MGDYIVECAHIDKSFYGVSVLSDVNFSLRAGEVLALLGENGAGKSTLMKILSGVYDRDGGNVSIFGAPVGNMTPKEAQERGVAIIHQELNLCAHLTVADNIFLGREILKNGMLDKEEMSRRSAEILRGLNIEMDPDEVVADLSVSKQQLVEIAKALSTNARVLIMDEPTSALTAKEIDDLFVIIRRLRDEGGRGIIYISHRLEELRHIADRVAVMRDGRLIKSAPFKDLSMEEIISLMVGREIKEKYPRVQHPRGKKIFEVKNLWAGARVKNVSLELFEGEIVGIAGLVGAGRTELTRAVFGVDPKTEGEIRLDGEKISIQKPADAIEAGILLVPEDRKKDGLCVRLSVRENVALPNLDSLCFGAACVVDREKEEEKVTAALKKLSVRMLGRSGRKAQNEAGEWDYSDFNVEANAGSLSGGNQQKIVLGKWLARKSRVVIFDEPTRGIDVAAKVDIYHLMNELKTQGIGVLFVSSEMPEIIGFADRIIVMCDGRITGEFSGQEATQDKILEKATQFEAKTLGREPLEEAI
jgi:ribose transport system ATP-binding protein